VPGLVVLAVKPGDRKEMGKLPEKNNREHDQRAALHVAASSRPAQHAGHCTGKRADEGADGMHFLQRRVDGEIDRSGRQ